MYKLDTQAKGLATLSAISTSLESAETSGLYMFLKDTITAYNGSPTVLTIWHPRKYGIP